MKSPPSKIVQLVPETSEHSVLALCEDGSVWWLRWADEDGCALPNGLHRWNCVSDPHKPEGDAL